MLAHTHRHGQIARKEPVLEDTSIGNVDALALVRHHDHRPAQRHVPPKVHVAGHREVIQLDDLGDLLKPLLELLDLQKEVVTSQFFFSLSLWAAHLLEVVTELDYRGVLEHPLWVDHQLSVFQRINVALDQKQVRARFYGKEPIARNVDSVGALKVLDRRSGRRLELDDCLSIVCLLGIDDDFQIHAFALHDPLQG